MSALQTQFDELNTSKENSTLHIFTLGEFRCLEQDRIINDKAWGRDKTIQLFQFLVTARNRKSVHKEQIIDRLWTESGTLEGNRDFKVAMHGINKTLEPNRPPRTEPKYILRQGVSYQLNTEITWIDAAVAEEFIKIGNEAFLIDRKLSIESYRNALELYRGIYLPNRAYEDWSSEERERLQVLVLGAHLSLAELVLPDHPLEAVRLTQRALTIDHTWEDAYELQMKAYIAKGNRPAAIKAFHQCVKVLDDEYGLDPLPKTQELFDSIVS